MRGDPADTLARPAYLRRREELAEAIADIDGLANAREGLREALAAWERAVAPSSNAVSLIEYSRRLAAAAVLVQAMLDRVDSAAWFERLVGEAAL